jgi:hypothetical protein
MLLCCLWQKIALLEIWFKVRPDSGVELVCYRPSLDNPLGLIGANNLISR